MDTGLRPQLEAVVAKHSARWQIGQDQETGVWAAVERPTPTALHVVIGHSLAELDAKLDAEPGEVGP